MGYFFSNSMKNGDTWQPPTNGEIWDKAQFYFDWGPVGIPPTGTPVITTYGSVDTGQNWFIIDTYKSYLSAAHHPPATFGPINALRFDVTCATGTAVFISGCGK